MALPDENKVESGGDGPSTFFHRVETSLLSSLERKFHAKDLQAMNETIRDEEQVSKLGSGEDTRQQEGLSRSHSHTDDWPDCLVASKLTMALPSGYNTTSSASTSGGSPQPAETSPIPGIDAVFSHDIVLASRSIHGASGAVVHVMGNCRHLSRNDSTQVFSQGGHRRIAGSYSPVNCSRSRSQLSSHRDTLHEPCFGLAQTWGVRNARENSFVCKRLYTTDGRAAFFFGVFDAHGGIGAATFAKANMWLIMQSKLLDRVPIEEALRSTFEETDDKWMQEARRTDDDSGTSAIVCLIIDLEIYTANVGDGSATVYNAEQHPQLLSTTQPHDSSAESQHIIAQVGSIDSINGLPGCANGILPVSRGLGCHSLTRFLSAEPSIKRRGILETDQALILATNGLNVLSPTQVPELAASAVKDAEAVAYWLCETAAASGLQENLTVLVIHLASILTGPASRYTSLTGSPMNAIAPDGRNGDKEAETAKELDDEKEEITMQQ